HGVNGPLLESCRMAHAERYSVPAAVGRRQDRRALVDREAQGDRTVETPAHESARHRAIDLGRIARQPSEGASVQILQRLSAPKSEWHVSPAHARERSSEERGRSEQDLVFTAPYIRYVGAS